MRFLLLVAVCSLAVFASADDKKKRDILPGDPRYGTNYHHKHHSAHKNGLEVTKSHGGYVGTYTVPEVNTAYGPPEYQPGKPIIDGQLTAVAENNVDVSSASYGVPERTVQQETVHAEYGPPTTASTLTSYGSPVTIATKTVEKVENPVVAYGVPTVRKTASIPTEEKVETTVVRTTSEVVPEVKVHGHVQEQKTVHKTEVKTVLPSPTAAGVVVNAPSIDTRLLDTNVGVFPSADLSGFSNLGSVSFNNDQAFLQPQSVGFDTTYDLQGNNQQYETQYPNFYGNQFVNPGSYDASLSQVYQVPQTVYAQQAYSPVSSQYGYPVPYALRQGALFQTNVGATQKTGPIADFFQETFPNVQFPQLPQLPQLSNLASFFQFPTQATLTAPIDATDVEVKKQTEHKVSEVPVKHHVKSVPVSIDSASKKDTTVFTKTTKEYTQPIDSNGGYVY